MGRISILAEEVGDNLQIRIFDDGRGLAIGRLRTMGQESGNLSKDGPEEVANLIFQQGLSTAKKSRKSPEEVLEWMR